MPQSFTEAVRASIACRDLQASENKREAHRKTGMFQKTYTCFDVTTKESHYPHTQ